MNNIFFDKLDDGFSGTRPTLSSIRASSQEAIAASAKAGKASESGSAKAGIWSKLISATSIEDEIKKVRLRYDGLITTSGRFVSGGYQTARLELTILATLFAVAAEYSDDVRWKSDANAARDLLGRTAYSCTEGTAQSYNEAKQRKADLQDLMSGTGLGGRQSKAIEDWSTVADRSPLMEYAEMLVEALEDDGRDDASITSGVDNIRRRAELLAMLGEVLTKEGIDGAGDEDYEKFSRDMSTTAREVVAAIERKDNEAIRIGISGIRSRCDACHAEYR